MGSVALSKKLYKQKLTMKCHLSFLISIVFLSGCSFGSSETNGKNNGSEEVITISEVKYRKLLDGLSHDYVLYS